MLHGKKEIVKATYGEKAEFSGDKVLEYPDFDLEFLGVREISMPDTKIKLKMMDFAATRGSEKARISYGTGILVRKEFEIGGRKFYLEIMYSKKFGDLAENEIVVSSKDPDRSF